MSAVFDKQFTQIIEDLMSGKFICKVSDPLSYDHLEKEAYRADVDSYLRRIGKQLARTEDGLVYFIIYTHLHGDDAKRAVRSIFEELANSIQPLVYFLKTVASATQSESTLQSGDIVKFSELLGVIEITPALQDDLANLVRVGLFFTQKSTIKDQFSHILTKLVTLGYLVPLSATGSNYVATGKWSFLYECMDFLATHERIKIIEAEQQMGLL